MRPLRPFCGTVLKAQLLTLPATISTSANGVVTTQLSFLPPASSSATEVFLSSESRPARALPPEPPPTITKSNVSVTRVPPGLFCGGDSAFAPFLARAVPHLHICSQNRDLAVTKTSKPGLLPFPKQVGVDTYAPHPLAMPGLPSQEAFGTVRLAPRRWPVSFPVRLFERRARFNAGWSSPVARQAHNLKVIGSNPIPATNLVFGHHETARLWRAFSF